MLKKNDNINKCTFPFTLHPDILEEKDIILKASAGSSGGGKKSGKKGSKKGKSKGKKSKKKKK